MAADRPCPECGGRTTVRAIREDARHRDEIEAWFRDMHDMRAMERRGEGNGSVTVTTDDLEQLKLIAERLFRQMDEQVDKPADKLWWDAWHCLKNSLYDLHGAYAAMAV